jgi:hypothetical protein
VHGTRRTVFVGGLNLGKIAKAAGESGSAVVDLSASGWSPKPGNIKKIADVLKNLQLQPCDTIVIDAMANCVLDVEKENFFTIRQTENILFVKVPALVNTS